jgi:hypothetical protein
MSNRFTPRATLQATPDVCDTRKPPNRRPQSGPTKWNLPTKLQAWLLCPDPHQVSTRVIGYTVTLLEAAVGSDTWEGGIDIWNTASRVTFNMPSNTGICEATIEFYPLLQAIWKYQNVPYQGPWPAFNTGWVTTPSVFLGIPQSCRIKVTL